MTAQTTNDRKFLIFSLKEMLYAIDLKQVAEVCDTPQMWPIPLAPDYYGGALNFHGDIVAVMDLSLFMGLPKCCQPGKTIVLHREVASLAFHVDAVVRIVSEDELSFSPANDSPFALATVRLNDGEGSQLDLEALVLSLEIDMQKSRQVSKY